MRMLLLCAAGISAMAPSLTAQNPNRVAGWRSDIDSLVDRIDRSHPNPWRFHSRTQFLAEARALEDSARVLSDGRMLTGIMRLAATLRDGHTGVIDLGTKASAAWFPVRFALFSDGLWITAITPLLTQVAGTRVTAIGNVPAAEVVRRLLITAQGDNIFNRRQHTASLSNGFVLEGLGLSSRTDSLRFTISKADGTSETIALSAVKGTGSIGWEQWGEMFGPPQLPVATAFANAAKDFLDPDANPTLPLHMRGRRAYWWTYLRETRTLYFQLNAMAAQSSHTKRTLLETWRDALATADDDDKPVARFVLDLRYNSGGDGSLVERLIPALIKRDSVFLRPGHFFVITSGKTFSAASGFVAELTRYAEPLIVGEPPGAGLNSSGDAGGIKLPYSGIVVSVSTQYTQLTKPRNPAATVMAVNVPAPMRGAEYFGGKDPSLEAILAEPVPYPNVVALLRACGAADARTLWNRSKDRFSTLEWWQPWRWQELNKASFELLEQGRKDDAIAGFEINTERNPRVWETWDSLGEAYLKVGRKDDALKAYRRAIALDPHNWNAPEQQRVVAQLTGGTTH